MCHITTVHQPLDNRIFYKECGSLHEAGYAVTLLCAGAKSQVVDGIQIIGFPAASRRPLRMVKTSFIDVLRHARRVDAAIYHVHDPELIPAGLVLRILGKVVVVDVHENTAASILSKPYIRSKLLRRVLSATVGLIEYGFLRFFSGVVTARPDISERFRALRPVTLRNFPLLPDVDGLVSAQIEKSKPAVIYVGGATAIRGTRQLVDAMAICDDAELWILGPFDDDLLKTCTGLPGWKNVRYLGTVPANQVLPYVAAADIGIVTFLPYPNHLTTLATKPFEYMACGLPIIMSDFPYWRSFFGDSALYVDPNDPSSIAMSISKLARDPELRASMGSGNASKAKHEFNWQREREGLLRLYERLTTPHTQLRR